DLLKQAEALYERVKREYASVKDPYTKSHTLRELVEPGLFEIRFLSVGKTVPEIEAEDLDGTTFKLSDYRGKGVLLVFCGQWCGPCRAMYPHERSLVKKLKGKPFALIGINSDKDRDQLKKILEEEKITWRSFWNGGSTEGPISTKWNVRAWPALFVIDHQGV